MAFRRSGAGTLSTSLKASEIVVAPKPSTLWWDTPVSMRIMTCAAALAEVAVVGERGHPVSMRIRPVPQLSRRSR